MFIEQRVETRTAFVSDELASYAKLPYHLWVNHSKGEYVNWLAHTNGVESVGALVKRSLAGTCSGTSTSSLGGTTFARWIPRCG